MAGVIRTVFLSDDPPFSCYNTLPRKPKHHDKNLQPESEGFLNDFWRMREQEGDTFQSRNAEKR